MSRKVAFLAAIPLLLFATAIAAGITPGVPYDVVSGGGGASIGDGVTAATGDILNAYDYANPTALTGDSAANTGTSIQGGVNASPFATTAANKSGGPAIISGGVGTTGCSAVAGAACAGDTVTVTVTNTAGVTLAGVVLTDGGNWTHSDTAATNATNLAAAITAHASLSPYVTASAVGTAMGIAVIPGKSIAPLTIATSDAACCTVVNGADGSLRITNGGLGTTGSAPSIAGIGQPGLGGFTVMGDQAYLVYSGSYCVLGVSTYNCTTSIVASTYVTANTDVNVGDDVNPTASACVADTVPSTMTLTSEEPYGVTPPAITPTNTTGGNIVLAPANGSRRLADPADNDGMCGGAVCDFDAGNTITISVQVDGVSTSCVLISAVDTVASTRHFICDGVSEATCGANIVIAASTVSPCSLMTVTAANNVVSFRRVAGSTSYIGPIVVGAGGTPNVLSEAGVDGAVNIPGARVVTGADTACTTTCGANRGCLFGQNTAALTYQLVACSDATADVCVCLGGA